MNLLVGVILCHVYGDWDPTGLYDSASIVPAGDNMYQYSNPTFDEKLVEYTTEFDDTARIAKAKELQAILYEDLPAISIVYPREIYGFSKALSGIDALLLGTSAHRPENWRTTETDSSITYALPAELTEYNIFVQESYYDAQWMSCVYYGLFGRSQDEHLIEPVLAKNYSVSEDKLTITVDINPDAYFSNGDPVTAYDVDYTYELYMTPAVASSSYGLLTAFFENNDSIVALDDDTVQFNLRQPYAFALGLLLSCGIINKDLVHAYIEANGYDMGALDTALVTGAGPYMLDIEDYDTSYSVITLHPNPYWALTNDDLVQNLVFTYISGKDSALAALAEGTVDIVDSQYAPVESDYEGIGANVVVTKVLAQQEMAINMKHPIIGTGELTPLGTTEAAKYIRKAISHAVPREYIVSEILQGLGAPGITPMPDGCVGFDTSLQPYVYDLDLAKQLIDQAYDSGYETSTSTSETAPTETPPTETYGGTTTFSLGSKCVLPIFLFGLISISIIIKSKQK